MCIDYSFPREGVGQQDVYNVHIIVQVVGQTFVLD